MAIDKEHYFKNLNRFLDFLDKRDLERDSNDNIHFLPLSKRICLLVSKFFTRLARMWNYIFGDHFRYDEIRARQIVRVYLKSPEKTAEQNQQIIAIYERLKYIREGNGSYADKLSINSVLSQKFAEMQAGIQKNAIDQQLDEPKDKTDQTDQIVSPMVQTITKVEEEVKKSHSKSKKVYDFKPRSRISAAHFGEETAKKIAADFLVSSQSEEKCAKYSHAALSDRFTHVRGLKKPSTRQLMHIHGNRFGKNSNLQGYNLDETATYLRDYLQKYSADPVISLFASKLSSTIDLIKHLNAKKIPDFVSTAQTLIETSFRNKSSVLLPGGWTGTAVGHAMYYEVIPETDSECKLRIYNSGAGLQHHLSVFDGNKEKSQTFVEWRVSKEKVKDENFLASIAELQVYQQTVGEYGVTENTDYSEKDIYIALRNMLSPKDVEDDKKPRVFISPQSSGVCSMRALFAVLRTYLEVSNSEVGKALYKRIKCDIRVQSLIDKINNYNDSKEISAAGEYRLIKKSLQKTCRAVERLYVKDIVGDNYLSEVHAALNPVKKWVEDNQYKLLAPKRNPEVASYNPIINRLYFPSPKENEEKDVKSAKEEFKPGWIVKRLKALTIKNTHEVRSFCSTVVDDGNRAWQQQEDQSLYNGLLYFISHLPTDDQFWSQFQKEYPGYIEETIINLGNIGSLFFKVCNTVFQSDIIVTERVQAFIKIQDVLKTLSSLLNVKLGFASETLLHFTNTDLGCDKELRRNFPTWNGNVVNNHAWYNSIEGNISINFVDFTYGSRNVDAIARSFGVIAANLAESTAVQNARIYANNLPEWLKAIRDVNLYFMFLCQGVIAKPTTIDRKKDFALNFTVNIGDNGKSASVDITVEGQNIDTLRHQYPNMREVLNVKSRRFLKMHGEISAEFLPLFGAIPSTNEKRVIESDEDYAKVGLEETQEILHIFSNGQTRVAETLTYFSKHPERLKIKEYQIILKLGLFSLYILKDALGQAGIVQALKSFFEKNYNLLSADNEIQTCVFINQCYRILNNFDPNNFSDPLPKLYELLNRKGLEPEEKSYIYAEIVAALRDRESDKLQEQDLVELIAGLTYLTEYPVGKRWREELTENAVRNALYIHSERIQKFLCRGNGTVNQAGINKILSKIDPSINSVWIRKHNSDEYVSEDQRYRFLPLERVLIDSKKSERLIPVEIRLHPYFRKLFPEVQLATYSYDRNSYTFMDKKGRETKVTMDKSGNVIIDQKIGNEFCRYIDQEAFSIEKNDGKGCRDGLESRHLVEGFSHWQSHSDRNKIYVRSLQSDKIEYDVTLAMETNIAERKTGYVLSKTSKLMTDFESSYYVQEWFFGYKLMKIELPRFGLTFQTVKGEYVCNEIPGYRISDVQSVSKLGSYAHSLVLEDAKGNKKVLLPKWNFKPVPFAAGEVFNADFLIDQQLEQRASQGYFVYDLTEDDKFVTKSLEANLYLIKVLIAVQEYESAAFYLKQYAGKITPYNAKEVQVLNDICQLKSITKDHHGNTAALTTYAGYLLLKNGANYHKSYKLALNCTYSNYTDYLNQYRNATAIRLEPREEIFLLTTLLKKAFDPLMFLRLRELDLEASRAVEARNVLRGADSGSLSRESYEIPWSIEASANTFEKPDFSNVVRTRAMSAIKNAFWNYYAMAVRGNESEKKWLWTVVHFLRECPKSGAYKLSQIFSAIMNNKNSFDLPEYDEKATNEKNKDTFGTWRWNIAAKLNEYSKYETGNYVPTRNEVVNVTPANFKMESFHKPRGICTDGKIKVAEFKISDESWATRSSAWFNIDLEAEEEYSKSFTNWLNKRNTALVDPKTGDEDLQKRAYEFLKEDFAKLQAQGEAVKVSLNEGVTLRTIRDELEKVPNDPYRKIEDYVQSTRKGYHLQITTLANKLPDAILGTAREELLQLGRKRKPITVEEIVVYFGRHKQDPTAIMKRNPTLKSFDVEELFKLVGEYLLWSTHEQQRERALETLSKLEKLQTATNRDPSAENDLLHQLSTDLSAQHYFDPSKQPFYLAFEYFAKMLLRNDQVIKIKEFLKDGNQNVIMEMLMGFGKTKVLLPLLALMLAKPEQLVLLISPQALFENISSDAKRILQDAFGQMLHTLNFDRNTTFTEVSLRNILRDIEGIQKEGNCLLMTSKSLQCLVLKFVEIFDKYVAKYEALLEKNKDAVLEIPVELRLMQKILNKFNDARTVVDEADSVLNVLRKVCFSLGNRKPPLNYEVHLISKIYSLLYKEPIKGLARIESDPNPASTAAPLVEREYDGKIKKPLAEAFVKLLSEIKLGSLNHDKALSEFVTRLKDESTLKMTLAYLTRDDLLREQAQSFYHKQSEEIKEVLGLAGQVISQFLGHTLTRVCDEKYGIDRDSSSAIAVPFMAANIPSKGSQFANHHITMMYTFQTIVKNGVDIGLIEREIERIRSQAMVELSETGILLEQTKAWKIFCLLKGDLDIPLFKPKNVHLEALVKSINQNIDSKLSFVERIVIPQLELFDEQTSCNPINLASFLPYLAGFTGTLWNASSMHRKVKPAPAEGISAKTMNILFKNSKNSVVTLDERDTVQMLEQLKKQNQDYDVIIDAGGYFKRGSNLQIAREIALWQQKQPNGRKFVVFYNNLGEQTVTDGTTECPLSQSSAGVDVRTVFLDQEHTTGADIQYKRNAVGVMTCGPLMLDRDFKQGAWRLRGLDKLQKVVFALSQDVQDIIKQTNEVKGKFNLKHIAQFVIANQCRQQSKDNFQSFLQQLWDIPQQLLIKLLKNETLTGVQYKEAFHYLRDLWIKPGTNTANKLYGNIAFEQRVDDVVKEESERCEAFFEHLHKSLPWLKEKGITLESCTKEISDLTDYFRQSGVLPQKAMHPEQDAEQCMEVEQQLEVELEQELEIVKEVQREKMKLADGVYQAYRDIKELEIKYLKKVGDGVTPRFSLGYYFNLTKAFEPYAKAFEDLDITLNVFAWSDESSSVNSIELFGRYRTPLHFVDVVGDRVTILSQGDAGARESWTSLYNLTHGFCRSTNKPSLAAQKKIVKVKFLNGDMHYTKEESVILEQWLKESGPHKMKRLFFECIMAGFPKKATSYQGSVLQTIFGKLVEK